MADNIVFILGLSLLFAHELHAIRCKEWRIIPGLSRMADKTGYIIFIFAHIPLLYWIFWQLTNNSDSENFRTGFDLFLIIHTGLHLMLYKHKNNEFNDWISWTIITGAGVCGLLDLVM